MADLSIMHATVYAAPGRPTLAFTGLLRGRGHATDQQVLGPDTELAIATRDLVAIDVAGAPEAGLAALNHLAAIPERGLLVALVAADQHAAATAAGADELLELDLSTDVLTARVTLLERRTAETRSRRAASTALEQSHANLLALIENIEDFVLFSDRNGAPLFFNRAYATVMKELLDLDMQAGIKPHERLTDPTARAEWDEYHRRVLAGEHFTTEYSHPLPDGTRRYFEVAYNPVVKHGEVIGFSEFTRDVTERHLQEQRLRVAQAELEQKVAERTAALEESNRALIEEIAWRKRTEEALRTSEARYREVYDTAPLAFVLWDRDHRIMGWNRHAEQIFGWSEDEALGRDIFELLIPDAAQLQVHEVVASLLRGDGPAHSINQNTTKRGEVITCDWNNALLRDRDGQVMAVLSLALDVTERLRLQDRLRHSEKLEALGQLAGGIAHDFNNQLVGIMGFADLLCRRLDDDKAQSYAHAIRKATQRSADLVAKLLAFARQGKQQSEPVDLHALISEVITLLKRSIDKRITLVAQLEAATTVTLGDQSLLHSALLNLALNGRDAMPDGGTLTFATEQVELSEEDASPEGLAPGRYVKIAVLDTGTGMDAATTDHIFEPFFTTKDGGTGMGLATAYGAVRSHHGGIRVTSKVGAGTKFELLLPLAKQTYTHATAPAGHQTTGRGYRILVVDDEPVVRDLLATVLRELGHHVVAFGDGERAIAHYQQRWHEIDLVIFDMVMPKIDGSRLFAQLREVNPGVRALLSSGYTFDHDKSIVAKAGVCGFLQKPYDIATVEAKVRAALQKAPDRT